MLPLPDTEHRIDSMVVVDKTLCVANATDHSIHLFSLAGAPIRQLRGQWHVPHLCTAGCADRLYILSEMSEKQLYPKYGVVPNEQGLVTVKECPDEVDELIWADISASKEVLVVALDDGHTIASYPSTDGGGMRRHNGQLLYIEGRDDSPEKGQLLALQDVAAAWA
jgi:hypothetical protein